MVNGLEEFEHICQTLEAKLSTLDSVLADFLIGLIVLSYFFKAFDLSNNESAST